MHWDMLSLYQTQPYKAAQPSKQLYLMYAKYITTWHCEHEYVPCTSNEQKCRLVQSAHESK